jgi:hypothetical protein
MKTNKYIKTLAVLAGIGLFTACTDLVTKEVDSKVIITSGGTTNVDPVAALEGSYNALSAFTDQANIYAMIEHTSDELMPPTRGVDWSDNGVWRSLYTHTWDPSHSQIFSAWNTLNQNAYNIQFILEAATATPAQKAEAQFLRAYNRYYIMDFWGQMPDRTTAEGGEVNPKVLTRTEAFGLVEADLIAAAAGLTSSGPSNINRPVATKEAAWAMLSRLYLNKGVYTAANAAGPYTFDNADLQKVVDNAVKVAASGYALNPNYFDNFKSSGTPSTETILTAKQGSPQNRVHMTLHYDQNPSGWNGFTTLSDFYAKFNAADKRRGVPAGSVPGLAIGQPFSGIGLGILTGPQIKDNGTPLIDTRTNKQLDFSPDVPLSGAATWKGYRVIKYHPAYYDKYVLLRYGEVYLNMVEAKVRGNSNFGTATSGLQDINTLRALRGAPALASVTLNDVLDERGRELYWEGHRRIDLVRFGKFNDPWSEKGSNTDAHRVLFTIPQLALDSNPNLKQNPGYGGN